MKVIDICERQLLSADVGDSLEEVAGKLDFHGVGALALLEHGSLMGIITERDIVRAIAAGADLGRTPALEYMTPGATTIESEAGIGEAASLMASIGARHLPVTDGRAVIGMLSARDLIQALASGGGGSASA